MQDLPLSLLSSTSIIHQLGRNVFQLNGRLLWFPRSLRMGIKHNHTITDQSLPILSKVLEHIMHEQVSAYHRYSKFFNNAQLGFRKGHSTATCLTSFPSGIYDNMENGVVSGVLFLDVKKAFDSVDHRILEWKVKSAGLTKTPQLHTKMWLAGISHNAHNICGSSPLWVRHWALFW